jgi:uncharacterized protein
MKWNIVSLDEVLPQPWRNGGGITRELLAWPAVAGWRLRLSVADVQAAGPFSHFDGLERWFAVLEGEGVVLRIGHDEHALTRGDAPFRFDGGLNVECFPRGGTTRDFNLMAPPGCAQLSRLRGRRSLALGAGTLLAAYAHHGDARFLLGGEPVEVPRRHLAWTLLDAPAAGELVADEVLWMEARP